MFLVGKTLQALNLVPGIALSRGIREFSTYSDEAEFVGGIQSNWKAIIADENGLLFVIYVMLVEWPVLLLAAYYLDQVGSNGTGIRKHPLWFLSCFQWKPKSCEQKQGSDVVFNVEKSDVSLEVIFYTLERSI